jgi:hypothetical protein
MAKISGKEMKERPEKNSLQKDRQMTPTPLPKNL